MELDGNRTQDFNTKGTILIDHKIWDTMTTTKLGLAVVQSGQQMFPDMRDAPVLVFPGAGLRSIMGKLARSTDNQLVEASIRETSSANSSVRGVLVRPMIEDLGRLTQGKVGHLESRILVKEDRRKTYLDPVAQAAAGVGVPALDAENFGI